MAGNSKLLLITPQLVIFDVPTQFSQSLIGYVCIFLKLLVVLELLVVQDHLEGLVH